MYGHGKFWCHRSKNDWVMVVLGFKCFLHFLYWKKSKFQKKYFVKVTLDITRRSHTDVTTSSLRTPQLVNAPGRPIRVRDWGTVSCSLKCGTQAQSLYFHLRKLGERVQLILVTFLYNPTISKCQVVEPFLSKPYTFTKRTLNCIISCT